jgi:hypothetical protein
MGRNLVEEGMASMVAAEVRNWQIYGDCRGPGYAAARAAEAVQTDLPVETLSAIKKVAAPQAMQATVELGLTEGSL